MLAVTLLHFSAPFPYDDYQVMLLPLLSAFVSVLLIRLFADTGMYGRQNSLVLLVWLTMLLNLAAAFASPLIQGWFVGKQDRIWWPLKEKSSLAVLRDTARKLKPQLGNSDKILTQDTYLAVEMNAHVPRGLELGPFSYYPDWSRKKALTCHVLNRDLMLELLTRAEAPVAALSGYSFIIKCPEVTELPEDEQLILWKALKNHYKLDRKIPGFGQADTTLNVYVKKVTSH